MAPDNTEKNTSRSTSSGDQDSHDGSSDHFIRHGLEHSNYNPKKILAWLVGLPIGATFIIGVSSYKYGISEVTAVVHREVPNVRYDRDFTFFEKINDLNTKNLLMEQSIKQCEEKTKSVDVISDYLKAKGQQ